MRCLVCRVMNLKNHTSSKGKEFQTFDAGGFHVVTGKHYEEGQVGVVIPPGAIIPDDIAEDMWLKGRLAGKKKNRVAAKQMFGHHSEAIFYGAIFEHNGITQKSRGWNNSWKVGDDVTQEMGVVFK